MRYKMICDTEEEKVKKEEEKYKVVSMDSAT